MEYTKTNVLKKEADKALRGYLLRNTPSRAGKYYCPLKKKYYPAKKMDVAHFIDRGVYHLRWDLRNVHLISADSNRYDAQVVVEGFKSLHHKEYAEYLDELGYLQPLLEEAKNRRILKRKDIIETINFLNRE